MFDLDLIEQDYLKNSFKLSEEEIIYIFQLEGVTLTAYYNEIDEYRNKTHNHNYLTAEERLLQLIFGENKKEEEKFQVTIKNIPKPIKPHLSKEAQKKIVEGCFYLVIESTRDYYQFFNGNISMEKIYYICLETLMNCAKYAVHNEKPVFKYYVLKSIEKSIIKYIAKKEHIDYKDAYEIIHYRNSDFSSSFIEGFEYRRIQFYFNYDNNEQVEKPSKIAYLLRNESFNIDYLKDISSIEFLTDYKLALDALSNDERDVMQLSYDIDGNKGLTYQEISEYLGIEVTKVSSIKKRAIKKLRIDKKLIKYV